MKRLPKWWGKATLWPAAIGLWAVFGTACRQRDTVPKSATQWVAPATEELTAVHRQLKEQEKNEIAAFVARRGRPMRQSGTGLYYDIYERNPSGAVISRGDAVDMAYTLTLLNGAVLASSASDGLRRWVVGAETGEPGLTELLLHMRRGEKAFAIIPSHLAYGLSGDGGRIPPHATLMYDIEIKGVYIKTKP
ncbi:MAG: FKBP-type peptidyl-prolyl cis-trans isomerase [Bacteroidales bacterium]|nr:FKBP-type peptidyl-prolyl cis-trans isomerase [Bacteroidales bacterium]